VGAAVGRREGRGKKKRGSIGGEEEFGGERRRTEREGKNLCNTQIEQRQSTLSTWE
jgi:hypothetical protein